MLDIDLKKLAVAFLVLAIFALVLVQVFQKPSEQKPGVVTPPLVFTPECTNGDRADCALGNGCGGTRECVNGRWGECLEHEMVCVPGKTATCALNSCSFGIKTCNGCGDAYGPCMPREEPVPECNASNGSAPLAE